MGGDGMKRNILLIILICVFTSSCGGLEKIDRISSTDYL